MIEESDENQEAVERSLAGGESRGDDLAALRAMLRKTRRELRAPLLFEGVVWFLVTVAAVAVSAQFAGLVAGAHGPAVMRGMLAVGFAAALLGGGVALLQFVRHRPPLLEIARLLQRHTPKFRNDIVAALQFGAELEAGRAKSAGWSEQLAGAHIRRTARLLLGSLDEGGTLAGQLPTRHAMPALVALGGALVLLVGPLLIAPAPVQKLWRDAVFGESHEAETKAELRPIVGEIDILYSYPPYSSLSPRFEPFTTGQIDTLVGTEVTLKTYPLIAGASTFEVVLQTADGSRVVPMTQAAHRIEASILLTKPGSYKFRAVMADGTIIEDGIERPIVLEADQVPIINVSSHPEQIEVSPDEILTIRFDVSDDFGIEAVSRAYAFGNEDPVLKPVELPELVTVPRSVEAEIEFDLRPLALEPKDVVTLWFEATDNNSLTGPGLGKSAPLVLRVASPQDRHMELIAAEQEVLEALLMVLADFLEHPAGSREANAKGFYEQDVASDVGLDEISRRFSALHDAHQNETSVLAQMGEVAERMKEDPLMAKRDVTLFTGLHEHLYRLNRDGEEVFNRLAADARQGTLFPRKFQALADHAALTEDALEKGLIRLDNLLALQKMDAVQATAEEIRAMKARLQELLEQYRDSRDPELKKAILREIQRLRQRMSELLARMQAQLEQLPREHVNMEAIEQARMESDAAKMGESLQQIEDLLEKGDIDGALAALDEMTASLDAMTEGMDQSFEQAKPEGMREMDKALSELMDKANDLEARQRDVEQRTGELQEKLDEQNRERTEQMLKEQTRDLAEMVEAQRRALEEMAGRALSPHDRDAIADATERVEELDQMIEHMEIEQALERASRGHRGRSSCRELHRWRPRGLRLPGRHRQAKPY